jgi:hypothetical protein
LLSVRFPRPLAEPAVHVSAQRDIGADELIFTPALADRDDLTRLAEAVL